LNLGFKPRFIPLIESGAKRQTVREGNRWEPGMLAHIWQNYRGGKNTARPQTLLFVAEVTKVEGIEIAIAPAARMPIWIDGDLLTDIQRLDFARADGFSSTAEMRNFWLTHHGMGLFSGQVIHWDFERRK